jgi:PadR family transcriptional regulator, regulatory protein AphA
MSTKPKPELTTTSYAILGLIAVKPWTTYELALQMERTLNRVWPRARSKLYEEPKKLVARGLAKATKDSVGKRPRTVYSITADGRRVLSAWLKQPAVGASLEFEALVKLFFADHGTKADALAHLDETERWAREQLVVFADAARSYLTGVGPFPERMATNMIGARFMVDHYEAILRWTLWARDAVESWPKDPGKAKPDWSVMQDIVRRVEALNGQH